MVRRLVCVAAGVLFFGAFTAAPAVAQVGPGYVSGPMITLCSTTAFVGEPITIDGTGFPAGTTVTANINPTLGHATVGADGTFHLEFTVPNLAPGAHTVTVTASTGESASATLTILPEPEVRPCLPTTPVTTPPATAPTAPSAVPPSAVPPSAVPPSAVPPSAVTPTAPPSGLAFTGTEIGLMAAAGAVLLVVGGMLVLTTRKRRSATQS